jgi:hypothetical protein
MAQEDAMRGRHLAGSILGLALVLATEARAQSLGETSAAMGVNNTLDGTAAPNGAALRERLKSSGNPSGSTCPIRILADYGKRVAAKQSSKSSGKNAWTSAGKSGGNGNGKGWTSASSGGHGGAANNAWAKNDKGTHAAPAGRRR